MFKHALSLTTKPLWKRDLSDATAYYVITESVWADTKVNTTACAPGT